MSLRHLLSQLRQCLFYLSFAEELEAGAPLDELSSDPDIELVADEVTPKILVTTADDIPTVRKRTKPAPVVSGKKLKLPLLSLSGNHLTSVKRL